VSRRTFAGLILGIAISGLCLWFAFKGVNLGDMFMSLESVNLGWVLASILLTFLGFVVRSFRWRFLLTDSSRTRLIHLISATFIGMMANNILPARAGEAVRAWALARRERRPVSGVLASIVFERLLDVVSALAILGGCLILSPDLAQEAALILRRAGLALLAVSLAAIVALIMIVRSRKRISEKVQRWSERVRTPWVRHAVEGLHKFLDGLHGVQAGRHGAALTALSLLTWAVSIASFQVMAEALHLGLSWIQMSLVFVIVLFGVAIPSAPGFVGTFHGFCVAGLTLVAGTESTRAAAFATLIHGAQWLAVTGAGLLFLVADQSLEWRMLTRISQRKD
jgi:uncharacterized protein (TIRG00374 family)